MEAILGADLLTNHGVSGGGGSAPDLKLPELESVELKFDDIPSSAPPPKLVPSASDIGPTRSWDGVENLNAESYIPSSSSAPKSQDAVLREKYEMLRKFERMKKLGVPVRKQFTLDSPIDEMRMEYEFIKREKSMDASIKQFSDWFVTGMSALEWGSKNIQMLKMFGLQLDGLSDSAQMNVGDLEEDFEELYELYGDKMKMHPLVRIPIRTCIMVYMVHLTNQMAQKAPVPNIQDILRQNPEIGRQLAGAAMQQQTQNFRQAPPAPAPAPPRQVRQPPPPPPPQASNPLAGLMSFMSGTTVPTPPPANIAPPRAAAVAPPPRREMKGPSGAGIGDILKGIQLEEKKIVAPPAAPPASVGPKSALKKSATSDAKKSARNSVVIKL